MKIERSAGGGVLSTLQERRKKRMGKKSKKGKTSNKGRGGGAAAKKRNTKSGASSQQGIKSDVAAAAKDSVSIAAAAAAGATVADTFNKENAFSPKEEDKGVVLNVEEEPKPSPEEVQEKADTEEAAPITIEVDQKPEGEAPIPSPAVVSIGTEPDTVGAEEEDDIMKNEDLSMMVDALVNEDEPTATQPTVEPAVEPIVEPAMPTEPAATPKKLTPAPVTPKKASPVAEERGDDAEIWDNRIKDVLDKDKPVYDVTPAKPRSIPTLDTPDAKDMEKNQECGCFIQ